MEEVAKQSKVAKETSDTLQSLMISIENLGDNLIKMRNETKSRQETEVMDTVDKLTNLIGLVSFLEIMKSFLEVINFMSTSLDSQPADATPDIFPIGGFHGIPPTSPAQNISIPSNISRPGISLGFTSNPEIGLAQSAFYFGIANVSMPQLSAVVPPP